VVKRYLFECPGCGYRSIVAGGLAKGANLNTQTILCRDCRTVEDCVVALRVEAPSHFRRQLEKFNPQTPPSLQSAMARLPVAPGGKREWRRFTPTCPRNPTHRVTPWQAPGRCPRCKAYLEQSALPYQIWE
jgi:hypothetical protein